MKENKPNISVVMATYNGEKYIEIQLNSILKNLEADDEVIISDDGSTDKTLSIIEKIMKKDKRICLIDGPRLGVKKNFENAIKYAKGKYLFLSDQDDIWESEKVKKVLACFQKTSCDLVVHDAIVFESDSEETIYSSFFEHRKSGAGVLKNIYKNTYLGCCMAFKSECIEDIVPIPNNIEMHDQWIGVLIDKKGSVQFLKDKLIKYRRHSNNVSSMNHYPLLKMIRNRTVFIKEFLKRI